MVFLRKKIVFILLFLLLPRWGVSGGESGFATRLQTKHPALPVRGDDAATKAVKLFGPRSPNGMLRLSLDECIQRALTGNPELKAADFSINMAAAKIGEADKIGYPLFEYEYNLAPVPKDVTNAVNSFFSGDITPFNRFKIGLGVPLNTFGKVKVGKQLVEAGVEAERGKKEVSKADIAYKVKQLYYGILLAREVSHLLNSAHEGVEGEVHKRETEGGGDPTELLKLKIFEADLEKKIEEGDKKEILAREALRVQAGIDPNVRFDLATDKLRPVSAKVGDYEQYRKEALDKRVELHLLELGYHAKEMQLTLEKRLMTPNVAVGGFFEIGRASGVTGVTSTDDFTNPFNFTRAGLGLQIKGDLDIRKSLSKIHQDRSELYKIEVQKGYAESGVELEVKEAFLDLQKTKQDMDRAEEAGKLSRQLLFLTQSSFDIGLAESKDLIDALSSFLQTRGQYFEAVFYYNTAVAKLDQKVGRVPE
ncbi:MAG: TolC family protein [Deltaproteobacteria bacterium]|nr:TolC family protein [Deltaproteobacteria bacterium]